LSLQYGHTRKVTLIPIAIAAVGVALIMAEEIKFQMELYNPPPCPGGLLCDIVIVRDSSLSSLGMVIALAGGVLFGIERLVRFGRKPLLPSSNM
jgi:hypothetical protein